MILYLISHEEILRNLTSWFQQILLWSWTWCLRLRFRGTWLEVFSVGASSNLDPVRSALSEPVEGFRLMGRSSKSANPFNCRCSNESLQGCARHICRRQRTTIAKSKACRAIHKRSNEISRCIYLYIKGSNPTLTALALFRPKGSALHMNEAVCWPFVY